MRTAAWWIIIDKNKRILLIKRGSWVRMFPYYWWLPSGRWEDWETPEQTAVREVFEEVWLKFKPTKLFMESVLENSWVQVHAHRYLWNWSWKINIQEEECDGFAWYTYEETKDLKIAFDYREMIERLYEEGIIG